MRKLPISIASSRFERQMAFKEVTWESIKKKLSAPIVGAEIYAEYLTWDREQQTQAKDAGGYYIIGEFAKGLRHNSEFVRRATVTLDIDKAPKDFKALLKKAFGSYEYFWHTSRKSCLNKPRIRVHIPLTTDVHTSDEYEALARSVASLCGFDIVDRVSYIGAQMMFFSTVSTDGVFEYGSNSGKWLEPRAFLESHYLNWQDRAEWPRSDDEPPPERRADKAANALTKPGVIGAFNRAYSITRALEEVIPGVYEPAGDTRWRYYTSEGGGGARVYDNDTAFYSSHTGHDPVAEMSCNAFDLVRIHKFGSEDEDQPEDAKPSALPSFKSMSVFAMSLQDVALELDNADRFEDLDTGDVGQEFAETDGLGEPAVESSPSPPGASSRVLAKDGPHDRTLSGDDPAEDDALDLPATQAPAGARTKAQVRALIDEAEDLDTLTTAVLGSVAAAGFNDVELDLTLRALADKAAQLDGGSKLSIVSLRKTVRELAKKIKGTIISADADDALPTSVERDDNGELVNQVRNMAQWLEEGLCGRSFALDVFTGDQMWAPRGTQEWAPIEDNDKIVIRCWMEQAGFKTFGGANELLKMALSKVCEQNKFDSAQKWLDSLMWDGVPRVDGFFARYFGVPHNEYTQAVARYWWMALSGRIIRPGVKADNMLVLIGETGMRKSTSIEMMVPAMQFFTLWKFKDNGDENAGRLMEGKLIGEVGELRGLGSIDDDAIKTFLAQRQDRWVPKYKERARDNARRILFAGTTENEEFLTDYKGNRRYFPIAIVKTDPEGIRRDLEQLYAEGAELFIQNNYQVDFSAERLAGEAHASHMMSDTLDGKLLGWLRADANTGEEGFEDGLGEPPKNQDFPVKLSEAMVVTGFDLSKAKRYDEQRVCRILKRFGFSRHAIWWEGRTQRVWLKQGHDLIPGKALIAA